MTPDIGVFQLDETRSYAFGFQSGSPDADLTVDLLIDGAWIQSVAVTYNLDDASAGRALFDLSELDLDGFGFGADPDALRVTNNSVGCPETRSGPWRWPGF